MTINTTMERSQPSPSYCLVSEVSLKALSDFFTILLAGGDERFFHPHPLTAAEAERRIKYHGNDLYFVQKTDEGDISGYGMLRGWDEGYSIPSLGIAMHPGVRGRGLGKQFILFLHEQARMKGAKQIRLTVLKENRVALNLYMEIGYHFSQHGPDSMLGFFSLNTTGSL